MPRTSQRERGERVGKRLGRRMAALVRARGLFAPGARLLAAVSGGPDSVALLCLLAELAPAWKLTVGAIHVHHGLRGAEADEDAAFVADLCDRLDLPYRLERIDLRDPGPRGGKRSLQESAREARYQALRRAAAELGVDRVALGHTADDQAETLLMWMLRGSGTSGLAGIPDMREGLFIRPLLGTSRAEILAYLDGRGQAFRQDSSNATPHYLRNRVRHDLLPEVKRFNPALLRVLERQARILREDDRCLEQQAAEHLARLTRAEGDRGMRLDRDGLLALPVALQRRVVRAVLRRVSDRPHGPAFGSVSAVLDRVAHGRSGAHLRVHGVLVAREYGWLCVERPPERLSKPGEQGPAAFTDDAVPEPTLAVAVPSETCWPPTGQVIRVRIDGPAPLGRRTVPPGRRTVPPGRRTVVVLDGDRFTWSLVARPWRPGDVFQPRGMGGHRKKVQDYFADIKLPRRERSRIPILEAPEGILWIGGHRVDHRFCASPSTTRRVIVELMDGMGEGRD